MITETPNLVPFSKIGSSALGFISVCENSNHIPFEIKRSFWTYHIPESVVRGYHAHYNTEMVLVALSGRIIVTVELPDNKPEIFILEKPDVGLYLPRLCWHTIQYSLNSVQLVLASTAYDENDYIRSYEEFKSLSEKHEYHAAF